MTDPKTAVEQVTTPATFNFAEAIRDRSYPEIDVPVYLDEKSVSEMLSYLEEVTELEDRIANMKNPGLEMANRLEAAQEKHELFADIAKESQYIVRVRGIAPEKSIEISGLSDEAFPVEYTENFNPITNTTVRTPVESDDRDELMAMLLRQAHLVSITAPSGAVDTDFASIDKVRSIIKQLPMVARAKIDEAINRCTITVDFYQELVDEVF